MHGQKNIKLHEDVCTFVTVPQGILLRKENFAKVVEKKHVLYVQ